MTPEEALLCKDIETDIERLLGQDNNHRVIFNYQEKQGAFCLYLETINPKYNQMFLFHSEIGINKLDVLKKTKEYVTNHANVENSYTIQWSAQGEPGVRTSYFHAHSIEDALEKFRYGRDRNKTTIFLISLNPKG